MSKRITWSTVIVLVVLLIYPAGKLFYIADDDGAPGFIGSYADSGYFTFDPENIITSINQGEANVFTPFVGNPDDITVEYTSISWSQSDYLKIANLLNQQLWSEPLDLEGWSIYRVYFETGCMDNLRGFDSFSIVYYKPLGISNWERRYTTRMIDIFPWQGLVRWGGDTVFSTPIVGSWNRVDLLGFTISPVDALQIADTNGGKEARARVHNVCSINVSIYQDRNATWEVAYPQAYYRMSVDSNIGSYRIEYAGQ